MNYRKLLEALNAGDCVEDHFIFDDADALQLENGIHNWLVIRRSTQETISQGQNFGTKRGAAAWAARKIALLEA